MAETVLVGLNLTAARTTHRVNQNGRCTRAIDVAHRVTGLRPPEALAKIAASAAVLPTACYGSLWTMPAEDHLKRLTSAAIKALYGPKHHLRCAEIISVLFMDPVRMVPTSAIIYRNLMDIRRLLLKSDERRRPFFVNLELAQEEVLDNVHGPARGLITLAKR